MSDVKPRVLSEEEIELYGQELMRHGGIPSLGDVLVVFEQAKRFARGEHRDALAACCGHPPHEGRTCGVLIPRPGGAVGHCYCEGAAKETVVLTAENRDRLVRAVLDQRSSQGFPPVPKWATPEEKLEKAARIRVAAGRIEPVGVERHALGWALTHVASGLRPSLDAAADAALTEATELAEAKLAQLAPSLKAAEALNAILGEGR